MPAGSPATRRFLDGLQRGGGRGAAVFGECGGYMVLGAGLIDADGQRHAMAGLLPLETSFAERRLHLGYRRAELFATGRSGRPGARFRGHEFHYAPTLREGPGAAAVPLPPTPPATPSAPPGWRQGRSIGSFIHLIDRA